MSEVDRAKLPVRKSVDVLVAGGGPAGIMAAAAAKRAGADSVLLVERYGFLGGMLTAGAVMNMRTFNDKAGNLVVSGLPIEFIEKLDFANGVTSYPERNAFVRQYPETTKYVADRFCEDNGVEVLLHTVVVDAIVADGQVKGVVVEHKSGREIIWAKSTVDASGDADVAYKAGAEYEKSDGETLQPLTTTFILGGVAPDTWPTVITDEARQIQKELVRQGKYPIKRQEFGFFPLSRKGWVYANLTRQAGDATSVDDLTRSEIQCRKQIFELIELLKECVPGFENAYLVSIAPQVGIRETRRIVGRYMLTSQDVLNAETYSDSIARGSYMIDIHYPNHVTEHIPLKTGSSYTIPYRCLLPKSVAGLLVAGRCISATHRAQGSSRCIASCMATGQAAGVAAAVASSKGLAPHRVDVGEIQRALTSLGAII